MTLHTIEKQQMQTLEALAHANMRVSETKNTLSQLQEKETEYLVTREKKVLTHIQKIITESADVLKQAKENYQEVTTLLTVVNEVCDFIGESEKKMEKLFTAFDEKSELWEKKCAETMKEFDAIKKTITADTIMIENDKKGIEKAKKLLANQQRKIDDERGTLERAINRLKQNRI